MFHVIQDVAAVNICSQHPFHLRHDSKDKCSQYRVFNRPNHLTSWRY